MALPLATQDSSAGGSARSATTSTPRAFAARRNHELLYGAAAAAPSITRTNRHATQQAASQIKKTNALSSTQLFIVPGPLPLILHTLGLAGRYSSFIGARSSLGNHS